jgi:hypothetical protein
VTLACPQGTAFLGQAPLDPHNDIGSEISATVKPGDILLVEFLGLLGAALSVVALFRRLKRGTSTPYNVAFSLAILKLPTGALTAAAGLILMRADFVPGPQCLGHSSTDPRLGAGLRHRSAARHSPGGQSRACPARRRRGARSGRRSAPHESAPRLTSRASADRPESSETGWTCGEGLGTQRKLWASSCGRSVAAAAVLQGRDAAGTRGFHATGRPTSRRYRFRVRLSRKSGCCPARLS